jgi:hypothetical protein
MPIDPQTLGVAAAQFMEELENKHGADADLDSFALVAVVDAADQTTIEFRFMRADGSATPVHVARGILAEVDRGLTRG